MRMPARPVLHGDNGATLKATTVLAMLHWLGIKPSYSRPRVSDDNAYAEALFRTAKYRPEFPLKGFADLDAAQAMGGALRPLVQPRAPAQRHPLRHPGAAPCRAGSPHAHRPPRALPAMPGSRNPRRWSGADPQLDAGRAPSRSIRSATPSSGRRRPKSSFPVRSASLLSRPDLAAHQAMARNEGDGRSAATRSHAQRALGASMARMASTGPSPK